MKRALLILIVLMLCVPLLSWAEQADAVDYSARCTYGVDPGIAGSKVILTDDSLKTHIATNGKLIVLWDETVPVRQLYYELAKQHEILTVEQYDKDRKLIKTEDVTDGILVSTYALEEETVRVRLCSPQRLDVSTLLAFGEGEIDIYRWLPPSEKADCMVITAHTDDAISIMGGVIATCVDRDIEVSVVCVATDKRVLTGKFLDALSDFGVKNHPILMGYSEWDTEQFHDNPPLKRLVKLIRALRPEIIVAPNTEGEDDNWQHGRVAALVCEAIELAADPSYDAVTEAWQVKALYQHLAADHPVKLDVTVPLNCYSGRTAFEQTELAYTRLLDEGRDPEAITASGMFSLTDFNLSFEFEGGAPKSDPFRTETVLEETPTPSNEPSPSPTAVPSIEPIPTAETTPEPTEVPISEHENTIINPPAATSGGGCNFSLRALLHDKTLLIIVAACVALLLFGLWRIIVNGFKPRKKSRKDSKPSSRD